MDSLAFSGNNLLLALVFWPMAAAIAVYFLGRKSERLRDIFAIAAVAITFISALLLALNQQVSDLYLVDWGAFALYFRADGFRAIYVCITAFLWLVTAVFSPEYFGHSKNVNRYWLFNLLTLGAVMGVFLSADFRTTFLFFEIMSFTSYALVAHDENPKALRAAETLLGVSIICGLILLMGLWIMQLRFGTLEFAKLQQISLGMPDKTMFYLPGALMLVGFAAKAGMFPLHIWLPKAHPVAPAPASALLSGILTKTGVFGVAIVSSNIFMNDIAWGTALLIPAVITMFLGAVLGVFSNDLKRTLACSSVSQIGFILTGVAMLVMLGDYNALAARGTFLHMLNHSLFKLILFVSAGVVYINRHELGLNKIRGFGRGKPLFFFIFLMAALGITGVPLWSGYISKTLLKKSLSEGYYLFYNLPLYLPLRISYWVLIITGGLTFAYMTKLFVTLFIDKGEDTKTEKRYLSLPSTIALMISAALVPFLGTFTGVKDTFASMAKAFFNGNALKYAIPYFEWGNISGALTSIAIGIGVYLFIVRGLLMRRVESGVKVHADILPPWLDLESLVYRPFLGALTRYTSIAARIISSLPDTVVRIAVSKEADLLTKAVSSLPDTLMRLFVTIMLRLSGKSHVPVEFISLNSLVFYRRLRLMRKRSIIAFRRRLLLLQKKSAMAGNFYMDLLLFGMGICTILVYLFTNALLNY